MTLLDIKLLIYMYSKMLHHNVSYQLCEMQSFLRFTTLKMIAYPFRMKC